MGDIADEMINRYLDDPRPHDLDDEPAVECKYCHKECVWEQTPAGWRLFDTNGELHECNDPFELVRRLEMAQKQHDDYEALQIKVAKKKAERAALCKKKSSSSTRKSSAKTTRSS